MCFNYLCIEEPWWGVCCPGWSARLEATKLRGRRYGPSQPGLLRGTGCFSREFSLFFKPSQPGNGLLLVIREFTAHLYCVKSLLIFWSEQIRWMGCSRLRNKQTLFLITLWLITFPRIFNLQWTFTMTAYVRRMLVCWFVGVVGRLVLR